MLILIVDMALNLAFVSPDTSLSFAPEQAAVGMSIESCPALISVDPTLPEAARAALGGDVVDPVRLRPGEGQSYLRRIATRRDAAGGPELVIGYVAETHESRFGLIGLNEYLEAASDAFGFYDADDRLVFFNTIYADLFPGPEGALTTGMHYADVLRRFIAHGAISLSPEAVEPWVQKQCEERRKSHYTTEFRVTDGRYFRLVESTTTSGGRIRKLIDQTALHETARALNDVVDGAQVGTWRLVPAHRRIEINDRFAEILGQPVAALRDLDHAQWAALIHPQDRSTFAQLWDQLLRAEIPRFTLELRIRAGADGWKWCAIYAGGPNEDMPPPAAAISGVLIDVSSRHQLEEDLLRRDAAITATGDGLFITDHAGMIIDANPAMLKIFGFAAKGDVIDRHWSALFSRDVTTHLRGIALPGVAETGTWHGEVVTPCRVGAVHDVEISLTKMSDESVIWFCRDVTARKDAERELMALRDSVQRAQRQESVNLIAAGLTHDLTNLVALIAHLSERAPRANRVSDIDVMDEIHSAARQMVALLAPIRELGRRQADHSQIDLAALLAEVAGILRMGAPRALRITTEIGDEPLTILADRMQVMQVMLNLALNAREAVGDGAHHITLSLRRASGFPAGAKLETGVIPDAPFALMSISDDGPGMDMATRARIWEPYFTTKTATGTGLGLFVVSDIVRAAGGGIALTTSEGFGTTFHVALPLHQGT